MQWAAGLSSEQRRQLADVLVDLQNSETGDGTPHGRTFFGSSEGNSQYLSKIQTCNSEISNPVSFKNDMSGNQLVQVNDFMENAPPVQFRQEESEEIYPKDKDVKRFKKALTKRMDQAKREVMYKQQSLAD